METTTITNGLEVHTKSRHYSERPSMGRLYVTLPDFEPQPTAKCTDLDCGSSWCMAARRNDKPEHCEVDHKAWKAWLRREIWLTKERITPTLAEHWSVDPSRIKLRYSSKAGCGCGCSPGFIIDGAGQFGQDTWLTETRRRASATAFKLALGEFLRELSSLTRV